MRRTVAEDKLHLRFWLVLMATQSVISQALEKLEWSL